MLILWSALALMVSPFSGKEVSIPIGKESFKGYLAQPEKEGHYPSILVAHEWWGLNDQIKTVADRLAKEGYVALVPDLYRGKVGTDAESAHELMRGLPPERAASDLKAAAEFLSKQKAAEGQKMGIVGFCMGGNFALLQSIENSGITATVVCYGRPETDPEKLKKIAGPVLGIFGGADKGIGPEQVEALKKGLEKAGKKSDIHVFDAAGHAFMNPQSKSYREKDAEDAWKRILAFFKANLASS